MLEKFSRYLSEKKLFRPDNKILAAVSGGMDSVVLCHLLFNAGLEFAIAHCNFQLRGEESDGDEKFVRQLAEKFNKKIYVKRFRVEEYAKEHHISIQMAARELRYPWFLELAETEGYDFVAVAHHSKDVLETILLNLSRGSGISGLHGIKPKTGKIVRPLLFASREEISEYVDKNQLNWREDSSNLSNKYYRNLLRNEVIPVLKKINPNIENSIRTTVEKIEAVENIFNEAVQKLRETIVRKDKDVIYIDLQKLNQENEPVIQLFEIIKDFNFNYSETKDMLEVTSSGKRFISSTHLLVRDRKELVITPRSAEKNIGIIETGTLEFSNSVIQLSFSILSSEGFSIPASPEVACLDYDKLLFPLIIRPWKEGDWFHPLGMDKKKKISDLLVNNKVPLNLKERIFVITSEKNIVWVVGQRIDNRYKITRSTKKIYKIVLS